MASLFEDILGDLLVRRPYEEGETGGGHNIDALADYEVLHVLTNFFLKDINVIV